MLSFDLDARAGDARAGRVHLDRGSFDTPCFMPVGTRAAVRTVTPADMADLGVPVLLGNTYHLMLRPGADVVAHFGGLHDFMSWDGLILTDSGGYQVFSLEPRVDDEGAEFASTYDGSRHLLTPELAVDIQLDLGSDIQMVLDVCPPLPASDTVLRDAVDRTAQWAARARAQFLADPRHSGRAQFGIAQGGVDEALRRESARRTIDIGFEGYAVGGLSVGENRSEMLDPLAACTAELPVDQPRYLMGLGDPRGMVDAIARGVDMFDCVLPTRLARHGTVLTSAGRINLKAKRHALDDQPLDPGFPASPANQWSRGYLRHLLQVREPGVARILTLHNVAFLLDLVARAREAIIQGTFEAFRSEVASVWA